MKRRKKKKTLNFGSALILTIILRTFFFIVAPQLSLTIKKKRSRKDITKTSLIFTKDVNINFI